MLAPLNAIYDWSRAKGYAEDGPYLSIEGIPVQFLAAYNPPVEMAVKDGIMIDFDGVPARVLQAEYLAAIMLQTERAKDRARFEQISLIPGYDVKKLKSLVERHSLTLTFRAWTR